MEVRGPMFMHLRVCSREAFAAVGLILKQCLVIFSKGIAQLDSVPYHVMISK